MTDAARDRRILAARAAGETLAGIGSREGLSKQGVSAILKRAAHDGPASVRRSYVHRDGYRILVMSDGRQLREHRAVWEAAHGPIPRGAEIHHINGDKTDNRLSNLKMIDTLAHRKLHAGEALNDDGQLVKRCSKCGRVKPVEGGFYRHPRAAEGYVYPRCRRCHVAAVVESERRARFGQTRPRFRQWRSWMSSAEAAEPVLKSAASMLPERTIRIIRDLVLDRRRVVDVARDLGISEGRVSTIFSKAVNKIDGLWA